MCQKKDKMETIICKKFLAFKTEFMYTKRVSGELWGIYP